VARRAFLLGRNTGTLRHCAAYDELGYLAGGDLWLMQDCLGRLGFDQVAVAGPDASSDEICTGLEAVTGACVLEDTFVFYFAGHSHGSDGLQLVIKDPPRKRSSWMTAASVMGFLKDCPALCKLMILDSCESGQGAIGMLPDPGANVRILTATDGALSAQERTALAAGVFTLARSPRIRSALGPSRSANTR
jgi:Caspase domain